MQAKYIVQTDKGFNVPLKIINFPSGEVAVQLDIKSGDNVPVNKSIAIAVQGYDANTLFILANIKDALEQAFLVSGVKPLVNLFLAYLPNARYDRHMDGLVDGFALRVFADMLNLMKFNRVMSIDPHSQQAASLIKNFVPLPQDTVMADMVQNFGIECDALVAPDEGAAKKIYALAKLVNKPVITLSKTRDPATGKITGMTLNGDVPDSAKCLIVDDLCDGGRTFIEAGKLLREHGASSVELAVSHAIFSAGVENLIDNGIEHVYTTDSFKAWEDSQYLSVLKYF